MRDLKILLRDRNRVLVAEWEQAFKVVPTVSAAAGDYLSGAASAVVSPANSFGVMDGGLDLLLVNTFAGIQKTVQAIITEEYHGEMPVGCAAVVETGHKTWPFLVCAPTMRVPENVSRTTNAYLAFRAVLSAILKFNAVADSERITSVLVPGLGTGVGRMSERRCAMQMRLAWDSMQSSESIASLQAVHSGHVRLLSV